jgi:hypothetical protein
MQIPEKNLIVLITRLQNHFLFITPLHLNFSILLVLCITLFYIRFYKLSFSLNLLMPHEQRHCLFLFHIVSPKIYSHNINALTAKASLTFFVSCVVKQEHISCKEVYLYLHKPSHFQFKSD